MPNGLKKPEITRDGICLDKTPGCVNRCDPPLGVEEIKNCPTYRCSKQFNEYK